MLICLSHFTEVHLTENQEFLNIDKVLKTNVEATKRQLEQRKLRRFNNLKYKAQPMKEQIPAVTQANFKKSYANAVKGGTNIIDPKVQHLRKTSKTNIQEEQPNFLKKLELLHPAHPQQGRRKPPTRFSSTTKQTLIEREKKLKI